MNKRTARVEAEKRNHNIGRFETKTDGYGKPDGHYVAWCRRCGDALFAQEDHLNPISSVNPAVQSDCAGYGANKFARRR